MTVVNELQQHTSKRFYRKIIKNDSYSQFFVYINFTTMLLISLDVA